ncbi:aldo/keto reductase, partial [Halorubrum tibetense]
PLAGGRVREVEPVVDAAATHDTTPEAVALAWALSKEPVVTIPKASSEPHLRANLAAADLVLDSEAVAAIDAIDRELELFPE